MLDRRYHDEAMYLFQYPSKNELRLWAQLVCVGASLTIEDVPSNLSASSEVEPWAQSVLGLVGRETACCVRNRNGLWLGWFDRRARGLWHVLQLVEGQDLRSYWGADDFVRSWALASDGSRIPYIAPSHVSSIAQNWPNLLVERLNTLRKETCSAA